jgi:hypothetical protein
MMQVAGEGVATGLVEIPLRYMHTSVETIHSGDVARMAELLRALVGSLTLDDAGALEGERFLRPTPRLKPKQRRIVKKPRTVRRTKNQKVLSKRSGRAKRR